MERLTKRYKDGSYTFNAPLVEITDRLAAYEDTGLEPEEIKKLKTGVIPAHWGELFKAECDGRLVVLPCKVGDTVYINTQSGATLCEVVSSITKPEFKTKTLEGLRGLDFDFIEYGKTVFLTSEAAEAALEKRGNDHA